MAYDKQRLPQLLASLYRVIDELEAMFPGHQFTPDGHMIESLGVALAAVHYGITLHTEPDPLHDGLVGTRQVKVLATQGDMVSLRAEPEHLLVLKVNRDGTFEESYNGPGSAVWGPAATKPLPKSGEYLIRLTKLKSLMKGAEIPADKRLPRVQQNQTTHRW